MSSSATAPPAIRAYGVQERNTDATPLSKDPANALASTAMKASATPAAKPSRPARVGPDERSPPATASAMTTTTTAAHRAQVPPDTSSDELVSVGEATTRNTDNPTRTSTTETHSVSEIDSWYQIAAKMSVNSSDVVMSGCTTTSDPRCRAAACSPNPATSATRPSIHIGRRNKRTSRLGRAANSTGTSIAARCWSTTPPPNTKAASNARKMITARYPNNARACG